MKMYPKLMLNRLKVMGNPTFMYIHWASSSHVTHVHSHVAHAYACVNYE
jgi:hypothetical protein